MKLGRFPSVECELGHSAAKNALELNLGQLGLNTDRPTSGFPPAQIGGIVGDAPSPSPHCHRQPAA
jgi:hypothetical protein